MCVLKKLCRHLWCSIFILLFSRCQIMARLYDMALVWCVTWSSVAHKKIWLSLKIMTVVVVYNWVQRDFALSPDIWRCNILMAIERWVHTKKTRMLHCRFYHTRRGCCFPLTWLSESNDMYIFNLSHLTRLNIKVCCYRDSIIYSL